MPGNSIGASAEVVAQPLDEPTQAATSGELTHYFISYSRQEVSFADSLARELEKRNHAAWVDFRNLAPGSSWQSQLDAGVAHAKAILLVVSAASMASAPVKDEWQKSLRQGKRIILIIFESAELDEQLRQLEWVDFRQSFGKAMAQLETILAERPRAMPDLPPKDFRMPPGPTIFYWLTWIALLVPALLFGVVGALEFVTNKTFFSAALPLVTWLIVAPRIVPLAPRVKKRSYELQKIRPVLLLWAMINAIACLIAWIMVQALTDVSAASRILSFLGPPLVLVLAATSVIVPWVLARRLQAPEMYRWAGPKGVPIRRKIQLPKALPTQQPIKIGLEHAPPDQAIAQEIKAQLKKCGHICVDDPQEADTILVLLSAYNTTSRSDPQRKVVLPVLVQSCHVDPLLSKTQWIDLRLGGGQTTKALARLIGHPEKLLQTLGVLPLRTEIRPPIVNLLVYFFAFGIPIMIISIAGQVGTGLASAGLIPLDQESLLGSFLFKTYGSQSSTFAIGWSVLVLTFIFLGLQLLKTRQRRYFLGFPRLGLLITLLLNALFPALALLSKDLRLWIPR